jgi:predicted nuclease of predicted toxin-antitoxin system
VKLLFDQNLPTRIVHSLSDIFPNSQHVKLLGMAATDDRAIWNHARENGFSIISKDSDFHQMSFCLVRHPKQFGCAVATAAHRFWKQLFGATQEKLLLF